MFVKKISIDKLLNDINANNRFYKYNVSKINVIVIILWNKLFTESTINFNQHMNLFWLNIILMSKGYNRI